MSVILPTKDRSRLLRMALSSVAAQTLLARESVEVVVVNDGGSDVTDVVASTDLIAEVLDEVVRGATPGRIVARLVSLPSNRGVAAARNAGLEIARGEWVAFLDDDDIWVPHHLATVLDTARTARADLAHASCLVADHRVSLPVAATGIGGSVWVSQLPGATNRSVVLDWPLDPATLLVTNYITVTSVICRRREVLDVLFDETATVQEDWRLWLELTVGRGCRAAHVDALTAVYNRVPASPAMTTWATSANPQAAAEGLRAFADGAESVWALWPVPAGGPASRARDLVRTMYRLCSTRLEAGLPVAHFYYEDSLPAILASARGDLGDGQARARVIAAVTSGAEAVDEGAGLAREASVDV